MNVEERCVINHRYQILNIIGEGGMGTVYRAYDLELNRDVALKLLKDQPTTSEAVKRIQRESQALAALKNPLIIAAYSFGHFGDVPYIVMELIAGQSIQFYIDENGPMNWQDCCAISLQAVSALKSVHEAGVIHRDIKPSNLLIEGQMPSATVKLIDFGLCQISPDAKGQAETLTSTGVLLGSFLYMSPEACIGAKIAPPADVYAWGCTMYFMLTGQSPFSGTDAIHILYKHRHDQALRLRQANSSVDAPYELEKPIFSMLEKEPNNRPSIQQVEQQLREISAQQNPLLISEHRQIDEERKRVSLQYLVVLFLALFTGSFFLATTDSAIEAEGDVLAKALKPAQFSSVVSFVSDYLTRSKRIDLCTRVQSGLINATLPGYTTDERLRLYREIFVKSIAAHNDQLSQRSAIKILETEAALIQSGQDQNDFLNEVLIDSTSYLISSRLTDSEVPNVSIALKQLRKAKMLPSPMVINLKRLEYCCLMSRNRAPSHQEIESCILALGGVLSDSKSAKPSNPALIDKTYQQLMVLLSKVNARTRVADNTMNYSLWLASRGRTGEAVLVLKNLTDQECIAGLEKRFDDEDRFFYNERADLEKIESFVESLPQNRKGLAGQIIALHKVLRSCQSLADKTGISNQASADCNTFINSFANDLQPSSLTDKESKQIADVVCYLSTVWDLITSSNIVKLEKLSACISASSLSASEKGALVRSILIANDTVKNRHEQCIMVERSYQCCSQSLSSLSAHAEANEVLLDYAGWLATQKRVSDALVQLRNSGIELNSSAQLRAKDRFPEIQFYVIALSHCRKDSQISALALRLFVQCSHELSINKHAKDLDCVFASIDSAIALMKPGSATLEQRKKLTEALAQLRTYDLPTITRLNVCRLLFGSITEGEANLTSLERALCMQTQQTVIIYGTGIFGGVQLRKAEVDQAFQYCFSHVQDFSSDDEKCMISIEYARWLFAHGRPHEANKYLAMISKTSMSPSRENSYRSIRVSMDFAAGNYRSVIQSYRNASRAELLNLYYSVGLYNFIRLMVSQARADQGDLALATLEELIKVHDKKKSPTWFTLKDIQSIVLSESGKPEQAWCLLSSDPHLRTGTEYGKSTALLRMERWNETLDVLPLENDYKAQDLSGGLTIDLALKRVLALWGMNRRADAAKFANQVLTQYKQSRDSSGVAVYPDPELLIKVHSKLTAACPENLDLTKTTELVDDVINGLRG